MRVYGGIMPSEAIELLREPLEALNFVQLCLLGFWVLEMAAHRGMDTIIELCFVQLVRSVEGGEQEEVEQVQAVREEITQRRMMNETWEK